MNPNVKGVLINVFGGITRGDVVAAGILEATQKLGVKLPMVVRMAGTQAEAGLKLLEGSALVPEGNPVEAARKIIALTKGA
jgi:succinyl-CoA synthetase beta subunit